MEFIVPRDASDLLPQQIAQVSDGTDEVIKSLSQVNSEEAKPWKVEDEIRMNLVTRRGGFEYAWVCASRCFSRKRSRGFSVYILAVWGWRRVCWTPLCCSQTSTTVRSRFKRFATVLEGPSWQKNCNVFICGKVHNRDFFKVSQVVMAGVTLCDIPCVLEGMCV